MQHLGDEVARTAGRLRFSRDDSRQSETSEVDRGRTPVLGKRTVVASVIAPKVLAVELVATVHRPGGVAVAFGDSAHRCLLIQIRHPVHGDRAWKNEPHRATP